MMILAISFGNRNKKTSYFDDCRRNHYVISPISAINRRKFFYAKPAKFRRFCQYRRFHRRKSVARQARNMLLSFRGANSLVRAHFVQPQRSLRSHACCARVWGCTKCVPHGLAYRHKRPRVAERKKLPLIRGASGHSRTGRRTPPWGGHSPPQTPPRV